MGPWSGRARGAGHRRRRRR